MTVRGRLHDIQCPTLLATGEFDPLCPLEDAIAAYQELKAPKEMWVFENQFHQLRVVPNLGGLTSNEYVLDWLEGAFSGEIGRGHQRIAYIHESGDGPWGNCEWTPPVNGRQAYF